MVQKVILRAGGYYQLVKYTSRGAAIDSTGATIYQIEDVAGQLICHCGSSAHEADQLFDALEHPVRRRVPQPVV